MTVRVTDLPDPNYVLAENPPHELTIHSFPTDRRYRLSGHAIPQVGDVARCGVVKRNPPRPGGYPKGSVNCAQCLWLKGLRT